MQAKSVNMIFGTTDACDSFVDIREHHSLKNNNEWGGWGKWGEYNSIRLPEKGPYKLLYDSLAWSALVSKFRL